MKPYLCIWRDAAAAPTCCQILLANGLISAMNFADQAPNRHGAHVSFHLLVDTPATRAAIDVARHLPARAPTMAGPDDATLFWAMQEDRTASIIDRPVTLRWAFVGAARWQDAQTLADRIWPSRGFELQRGPALVYSAENGLHHLARWDAPIERCDLTFPHSAPMVTPETAA